jgi:hypothetical protein
MLEPRVVAAVPPIGNDEPEFIGNMDIEGACPIGNDEPEVVGNMDIEGACPIGNDEPEVVGNMDIEDSSSIDPEVLELARILQSMGRERIQHLVIFYSITSIHKC